MRPQIQYVLTQADVFVNVIKLMIHLMNYCTQEFKTKGVSLKFLSAKFSPTCKLCIIKMERQNTSLDRACAGGML